MSIQYANSIFFPDHLIVTDVDKSMNEMLVTAFRAICPVLLMQVGPAGKRNGGCPHVSSLSGL